MNFSPAPERNGHYRISIKWNPAIMTYEEHQQPANQHVVSQFIVCIVRAKQFNEKSKWTHTRHTPSVQTEQIQFKKQAHTISLFIISIENNWGFFFLFSLSLLLFLLIGHTFYCLRLLVWFIHLINFYFARFEMQCSPKIISGFIASISLGQIIRLALFSCTLMAKKGLIKSTH